MGELSVGVKIWGDIANLVKSLTKGKEEVKTFTRGTDYAFKDLTKSVSIAENKFKQLAVQFGVNSKEAKSALNEYKKLKVEVNNINSSLKDAGKGQSGFDKLKGSAGSLMVGFGALAAGAMAVVGAIKGVADIMSLTDEGATNVEAATQAVKSGFGALKDRAAELLNGTRNLADAFDGLGGNIQRAGLAADAYVRAMDVINDRNSAFVAQEARMRNEIAKLQFAAKDQTKSEAERKSALEKSLSLETEIVDFKKTQAKKAYEEELKLVSQRFFISEKVIRKIIEGDRSATENLVANNKVAAKAWDKLYGAGGEGAKLSQFYADAIGLETKYYEENKRTQSQITGFAESAQSAYKKVGDGIKKATEEMIAATVAYQKALLEGTLPGPRGDMTMGELSGNKGIEKAKSLPGQIGKISGKDARGNDIITPLSQPELTGKTGTGSGPGTTMTDWMDAIDQVAAKAQHLDSVWQNVFRSFSTLAAKVSTGFKNGWKDAMSTIGDAVQSGIAVISQLFTQSTDRRISELDAYYESEREKIEGSRMNEKSKAKAIEKLEAETATKRKVLMREQAKQQKTASLMQAIVAGALAVVQAFAAGPGIGMVLGLLMTGLVAAQVATIASQPLPALAQGGLASAPTLALVGDNPNARIDPEVISPLSKLKDMIGMGGQGEQALSVRLSGDDLLFVLERAQRSKLRRY